MAPPSVRRPARPGCWSLRARRRGPGPRPGPGTATPWCWSARRPLLVVSVVQWVAHGRSGWTVGRRAVGIRTLDVESRTPIGMLRVLRAHRRASRAGVLAFGVGLLVVLASPAFDRTGRRRGWQDLAARDEVLDVRAVRVPVVAPPRGAAAPSPRRERAGRRPVSVPGLGRRRAGDGRRRATALLDLLLDEARPAALVLAPLAPQRSGPDLDTRATPVVRQVGLSYGLAPELELTRPAGPRDDLLAAPVASAVVDRTVAEIELGDGRASPSPARRWWAATPRRTRTCSSCASWTRPVRSPRPTSRSGSSPAGSGWPTAGRPTARS